MTLELLIKALEANYRFQSSKGELDIVQIARASEKTLSEIGVKLEETNNGQIKSRFRKDTGEDTIIDEKLKIVQYFYDKRQEERLKKEQTAENNERIAHLKELITQKQNESLSNMSIEELQKQIDELSK